MGHLFSRQVDVILEDASIFTPAISAMQSLDCARESVVSAERDVGRELDAIHNQLALEIRRANPALTVALGRDGSCCVAYKNFPNKIRLKADPSGSCFAVGDSSFERRFKRYHGHCLACEMHILGKAVGDFFKQNYRSIR